MEYTKSIPCFNSHTSLQLTNWTNTTNTQNPTRQFEQPRDTRRVHDATAANIYTGLLRCFSAHVETFGLSEWTAVWLTGHTERECALMNGTAQLGILQRSQIWICACALWRIHRYCRMFIFSPCIWEELFVRGSFQMKDKHCFSFVCDKLKCCFTHHNSSHDHGSVLHARRFIRKQGLILGQDQLISIVPIADLEQVKWKEWDSRPNRESKYTPACQ